MSTEKRPVYRANLQAVVKTVRCLNLQPHHITELKRTPFWLLIEAILNNKVKLSHCKRHAEIITKIIGYFEKPSLKIMFEDHEMQIDEVDVRLIFGIKDGDKKLELYPENFMKTPFLERCFPDRIGKSQDRLGKPLIHQRLVQAIQKSETIDAQDVARLLTVYILATLLIPSKNTSVPWTLTTIVNDLDAICDHNWSGLVIDTLITSVKGGKAANHSGCVVMLPYWLCEHTTLVHPIRTGIFPRFLKWNLEQFQEVTLPSDLKNLNDDQIVRGLLKASESEKALLENETAPHLLKEEPSCLEIEGERVQPDNNESSAKDIGRRGKRVLDVLFNVPPVKKSRSKKDPSKPTGCPAVVNNDNIPEWVQVLESVRELTNTNPGDWVRTYVSEALQKTPPEWAKAILENLISKTVYRDSHLGPTKELIISVLNIARCERVLYGLTRTVPSPGVSSDGDADNSQPELSLIDSAIIVSPAHVYF